jgi:hypothetical protein
MTEARKPDDESAPLTRRDVLRLSAASAGVPLFAHPATHQEVDGEATPAALQADHAAQGPALPGEDHPEARAKTIDNLKTLGLAMHWYAATNGGRFPPAAIRKDGQALLSWRVALLPFICEGALYRAFRLDEPWDSDHNKALLHEIPSLYAAVISERAPRGATYYQGFLGPGALFDGEEGTRIADVLDGLSWTLMIVEAAQPVPWSKPEDVPFDEAEPLPKIGGQFDDGSYVGFADGSARFLSNKVAPVTLRALITRARGDVVTFDMLGPWRRVD